MSVVLTTVAATLFIQLGYFLWKISADRRVAAAHSSRRSGVYGLLTDRHWLLGTACTSIGWILFVQATSEGEISVVQPLMSAGDLLLVGMAVLFLHERLNRTEWFGVALTVVGAVLLAAGARRGVGSTFDGFRLGALMASAVIAAAALLLIRVQSVPRELALALTVGLAFGCGSVLTEAMTSQQNSLGQDALSLSTLLNPFLLGVVAANVVGLVLLQAAFQGGRAAMIVPMQLAVANTVAVFAGVVVFDEVVTLSRALAVGLILAGTALIHIGKA